MNFLTSQNRKCWAVVLTLVAAILGWLAPPASAQYSESQVKAAFVLNFAQFSKWPPKALADGDVPFIIGIIGDDSLGSALDKACQGQTISGHKISIKRSRRLEDLKTCHLVFVSKSETGRLGEIFSSLQGASVLTVGETEHFARQSGAIGFVMDGEKVRFEINPGAARRAGIDFNPRLLKLGKIVSS